MPRWNEDKHRSQCAWGPLGFGYGFPTLPNSLSSLPVFSTPPPFSQFPPQACSDIWKVVCIFNHKESSGHACNLWKFENECTFCILLSCITFVTCTIAVVKNVFIHCIWETNSLASMFGASRWRLSLHPNLLKTWMPLGSLRGLNFCVFLWQQFD